MIEQDIREIYQNYGKVIKIHIGKDKTKNKKYAHIEFELEDSAQEAYQDRYSITWKDEKLYTNFYEDPN